MMETPAFLKPIQSYPGEIVQFIERIPGVDVTGDRQTVLERLEPYHRAEVETLGWRWKDPAPRRAGAWNQGGAGG